MGNLGRAVAKVEFYDKLPEVVNSSPKWQQFDFCGEAMDQMIFKSVESKPLHIQTIKSDEWCVAMPTWTSVMYANMVANGEDVPQGSSPQDDDRPIPRQEWHVGGGVVKGALAKDVFWMAKLKIKEFDEYIKHVKWKESMVDHPVDNIVVNSDVIVKPPENDEKSLPLAVIPQLKQYTSRPNLLWGATTSFDSEMFKSLPFIINLSLDDTQTVDGGLSNFVLIRINPFATSAIDLLLQEGRVFLYDWGVPTPYDKGGNVADSQNADGIIGPAEVATTLSYTNKSIQIGVLPCGGKLILYSHNAPFIYARVGSVLPRGASNALRSLPSFGGVAGGAAQLLADAIDAEGLENDQILAFTLQTHRVDVLGSNCSCSLSMSAMRFLQGAFHPTIYGAADTPEAGATATQDREWGILNPDSSGELVLDKPLYYTLKKGNQKDTGAISWWWNNEEVNIEPTSEVFVGDGRYGMINVDFEASSRLPKKEKDKVMSVYMIPEDIFTGNCGDLILEDDGGDDDDDGGGGGGFPRGDLFVPTGAPFLFRLKGAYDGSKSSESGGGSGGGSGNSAIFESYDIMSFNQQFSNEDIFAALQSVDLSLYYSDAIRDAEKLDLKNKSYFVKMYFKWVKDGEEVGDMGNPFFTGVTMDASISETPGKETIDIHCEDFMRILDDARILNSPFYDGLYWIDAVEDVVRYAGIPSVVNNCEDETNMYFLPSGYTFQQPRMKFSPAEGIKKHVIDIVKLCERVVYFDGDGKMNVDYLQGGLFFDLSKATEDGIPKFYRNPDGHTDEEIILDEKKTELLFSSSVNQIMVTSLHRETSQPIVVTHTAGGAMPWKPGYTAIEKGDVRPPYRKVLFFEQFAFGNLAATNNFVSMLAERAYKVPRKISIKTIGTYPLRPLTFFGVDDFIYRISSSNFSFNAEDNSVISSLSGEWLGAEQSIS